MSNIQIKTLSHVHIGNGILLQLGNDFLVDNRGNDSFIYILSVDKLGKLIRTDATLVSNWTNAIEKGEADSFVRQLLTGHSYKDISKRRITNYASFERTNPTLKECIHDGIGRPYIPGSSIKGAIRTIVFSSMASEKIQSVLSECTNSDERKKAMFGMEKSLLGRTADADVFRFLSTGDAYFDKESEIAVKQINLNITEKNKLKDFSKQQVVEAISSDMISSFRLNIKEKFFEKTGLNGLQALFKLINDHTRKLVQEEIDYWDGFSDDVNDYVSSMEDVLTEIKQCQPNECVLRIGQGSGWRFISGAWLESIDQDVFDKEVAPLCRPNNYRYQQYDFPKSRRIDDESYVFGFVKLESTD